MKSIVLLLSLFIGLVSNSQDKCALFKTGKFQNIEDGVLKATIERDATVQIEKYGNKTIKLKIAWLDECSYQLSFLEGNQAFWDSRPDNMPTEDLIVRITSINGNSYIQESKFVNDDEFVYKSEIEKIE